LVSVLVFPDPSRPSKGNKWLAASARRSVATVLERATVIAAIVQHQRHSGADQQRRFGPQADSDIRSDGRQGEGQRREAKRSSQPPIPVEVTSFCPNARSCDGALAALRTSVSHPLCPRRATRARHSSMISVAGAVRVEEG
jgi:hypothetical protein